MRTPGSDLPSTLSGPGWRPRVASHVDEVADGCLWTRCGYRSECAPLRAVALVWPPDSFADLTDAGSMLMLDAVDLPLLREQTTVIAEAFRRHGVDVLLGEPDPTCPPNVVFQRDLFLMTPEGAVLGRPASRQRAGEERHTASFLARAGYPILRTLTGTATFEGADALWVNQETVLVGTGFRTNNAGSRAVAEALAHQGAKVVEISLRPGVQHLLGTVVFLDHRLAALHSAATPPELRSLLRDMGYRVLEFDPDDELVKRRGMNLVVLAPGHVLMPSGAPAMRRALEAEGVTTEEVEIGEYVKAAGGLGCVTGILSRD